MKRQPSNGKSHMQEFSQAVIEKIGFYVYLLIDPEDEKPFYVGKGQGNRIFAHVNDSIDRPTANDKLDRIRAIRERDEFVQHVILRHGLTEKEAFEIEASVIDLLGLEGLTNEVSGQNSLERGRMNVRDIIAQYDAHRLEIEEPILLITINQAFYYGMSPEDLYEYTRGNWVLGERRNQVRYACAVYRGIVREVYKVSNWFPAPNRSPNQKNKERWRFEGEVAYDLQHYVGGTVEHYIAKGAQNPIRYINC